jgi:hypothetical protein
MIRGETGGFMGLTLSADTWRVWGVYWVWVLLYMAFAMVMSIVLMAVMGVVALAAGGDPMATLAVLPFYYLVYYGLMIYFGVRLAPAAATTIARRRFSFFHAWTVTRGRFWALFGSFALLWLLYVLAGLLLGAVWFAAVIGPAAPDLAGMGTDPQRAQAVLIETLQVYLRSLAQPQSWILLGALQAIGMIMAAVFYISMYGVNSRAALAALDEGKIKPAT